MQHALDEAHIFRQIKHIFTAITNCLSTHFLKHLKKYVFIETSTKLAQKCENTFEHSAI